MKDQTTDGAANEKFYPIQISSELLQKAIDNQNALEAMEKQKQALHDEFWDEVCASYGLDREKSWELDKTYIDSGVVMLKERESCCGICKSGDMPDFLEKIFNRALLDDKAKGDAAKVVAPDASDGTKGQVAEAAN